MFSLISHLVLTVCVSELYEMFNNKILLHCWKQMTFAVRPNSPDINTFSLCSLVTNYYDMQTYCLANTHSGVKWGGAKTLGVSNFNPLKPELNPICYLLALLRVHHFLHVSRIRVKLLTFRLLMSYIYGAPILDVSRSHTTTQHSR